MGVSTCFELAIHVLKLHPVGVERHLKASGFSCQKGQKKKPLNHDVSPSVWLGIGLPCIIICCRANKQLSLDNGEPQTQFLLTLSDFPWLRPMPSCPSNKPQCCQITKTKRTKKRQIKLRPRNQYHKLTRRPTSTNCYSVRFDSYELELYDSIYAFCHKFKKTFPSNHLITLAAAKSSIWNRSSCFLHKLVGTVTQWHHSTGKIFFNPICAYTAPSSSAQPCCVGTTRKVIHSGDTARLPWRYFPWTA